MKKLYKFRAVTAACLLLGLAAVSAHATVIQNVSGLSATRDNVSFKSELTIAGDILTVKLFNISPAASNSPDDLLSSYFFDIKNSLNQRPTLVYQSAIGDVYLADKKNPDALQKANANIKAVKKNDDSWEFLTLNPDKYPMLGFGIGTVGNSDLSPNNFHGNITGGMNYSIFTGETSASSLHNKLFVKSCATFTFSGLRGFTEADIADKAVFGLGTDPDTLLTFTKQPVPEPASAAIMMLASLFLALKRKKSID